MIWNTAFINQQGNASLACRGCIPEISTQPFLHESRILLCLLQDDPQAVASQLPQALLLGTAVNQDGRSSSLTAPNGPAQQAVISAAMAANGTSTWQMAMLQMHGTGTPLGDPIEVGAATAVLKGSSGAGGMPRVLAAGKTSFGHQEPAAGTLKNNPKHRQNAISSRLKHQCFKLLTVKKGHVQKRTE